MWNKNVQLVCVSHFSFVQHNPVLVKTAQQGCLTDTTFMVPYSTLLTGIQQLPQKTHRHSHRPLPILLSAVLMASFLKAAIWSRQALLMMIISNTILSSESCSMHTALWWRWIWLLFFLDSEVSHSVNLYGWVSLNTQQYSKSEY